MIKNELLIFLYVTILIYSHYCGHNYTFPLIGMGFGHHLGQTKEGIPSLMSTMIIGEMQNIISRGTRVLRTFCPEIEQLNNGIQSAPRMYSNNTASLTDYTEHIISQANVRFTETQH